MPPYCKDMLSTGACPREVVGCRFKHDVRHCETCNLYLIPGSWNAHIAGKRHRSNARRPPGPLGILLPSARAPVRDVQVGAQQPRPVHCNVCGFSLLDLRAYEAHRSSRRHKVASEQLLASANAGSVSTPGILPEIVYLHCVYCNRNVKAHFMAKHEKEARHLRCKRASEFDDAFTSSQKNKAGINITGEDGVDFGILEIDDQQASRTLKVERIGRDTRIALLSVRISPSAGSTALDARAFGTSFVSTARWANFGRPISVEVSFRPTYAGRHSALLELTFHNVTAKQNFTIVRELRALVGSKADHDALKPTAPYTRPTPEAPPAAHKIHPGKRPVVWSKVKWKTRLLQYPIPSEIIDVAFEGTRGLNVKQIFSEIKRRFMPRELTLETYYKHFQVCLHIEEESQRRGLAFFALKDRTLEPKHPYYILKLKEMAQQNWKHKVFIGDTLLFKHSASQDGTWYQGTVHRIEHTRLILRFESTFSVYKGNSFDIQFVLNRIPFRRAHQAVWDNFALRRLLFPAVSDKKLVRISREDLTFFRREVGNNPAQREVVEMVLSMAPGCSPLVVSGPPGTGKTSTIVESIQQIIDSNPRSRVLACAPSNAAADEIAKMLRRQGTTSLLRLCAFTRDVAGLPDELLEVTQRSEVGDIETFAIPALEKLERFRVIVCTCVSSGILHNIGLPRGHFSFVFIDEAAQATEPESMIPIKTMADDYTNIVLSGDRRQLGPIVHSHVARELGYRKSYLQRLMEGSHTENDDSSRGPASGAIVLSLQEHYRSHEAIIAFPNEQFYNNELIPRADPVVTHSLLRRDILVNPQFPIVFHGIRGKDEREDQSPSFFNAAEASMVKYYVSQLMTDKKIRLEPEDIGIISPYNAQCGKITQILENRWPKIKVGSVEEFQGQERRVIIISTVRSSLKQVNFDLRNNLGFVADPLRFNVAITRAQALLIIIGDPVILSLDPLWRKYLNYIHTKGGWSPEGVKIDWNPNADVNEANYADERRRAAQEAVQTFVERTTSKMVDSLATLELEVEEPEQLSETFMDRFQTNDAM